jgi:hypothetical protein
MCQEIVDHVGKILQFAREIVVLLLEPLEPFSGSVNYTMANKRQAVTTLTFQIIDFGGETSTGRHIFQMLCII